jgi:hypothetical protein
MASALSHAFVATALGSAYARHPMPWYFWGLSITCSILPDADVIGFTLGIPYNSVWGHRGLSHSLCFALVLSLGVGAGLPFLHRLTRHAIFSPGDQCGSLRSVSKRFLVPGACRYSAQNWCLSGFPRRCYGLLYVFTDARQGRHMNVCRRSRFLSRP